jgi:leucyl aminopeptidase
MTSSNNNNTPPFSFPSWSFESHCPEMEWNELSKVQLVVVTPEGERKVVEDDDDTDLVLLGLFVDPPVVPAPASSTTPEAEAAPVVPNVAASLGGCPHVTESVSALLQDVLQENHKTMIKLGSVTPTLRAITTTTTTTDNSKTATTTKRFVLVSLGPTPNNNNAATATATATTTQSGEFGVTLGTAVATVCTSEKKIRSASTWWPPLSSTIAVGGGSSSTTTDTLNAKVVQWYQNFAIGFYQALYSDNRFRTGDNIVPTASDLTTVRIGLLTTTDTTTTTTTTPPSPSSDITKDQIEIAIATKGLQHGRSLVRGVYLTRDIVNAPHNVLNSESLAATAQRLAAESSSSCMACRILDAAECQARGMGAYLGVARGSETQPRFIHLTYTPPPSAGGESGVVPLKQLGIVGKGLLFDTGGYNIKTSMMELMKFDCGGAAAVLGAMRALGELQPPHVQVHCMVAACENMISHRAYVPSDILIASNGKTIEIMNTDAEGRLTLADALVYADKEVGCKAIVELSTLTGACMVALGKEVCGLWTNNETLAAELAESSRATGDKVWRMPMVKEYREQLKSNVADLKNLGTPYGGSITAALFLQNFVDEAKPFAHLDIAGPVWSEKTGATGFGAKLVVDWVLGQSEKAAAASSKPE